MNLNPKPLPTEYLCSYCNCQLDGSWYSTGGSNRRWCSLRCEIDDEENIQSDKDAAREALKWAQEQSKLDPGRKRIRAY